MGISCLAVLTPSNVPLYISTVNVADEEGLRLQSIVHSSLDVLEERVSLGLRSSPGATPDSFLGMLAADGHNKIYGFVSNTKIRILIAINDTAAREEDIKVAFRRVLEAYTDAASNPFYSNAMGLGSSRKFQNAVDGLVHLAGTAPTSSMATNGP